MQNFNDNSIRPFSKEPTENERINYLKSKNTNFVFLFGKPAAGKTAVTASLIHYLTTKCEYGELERVGNIEGRKLAENIRYLISNNRFPDRTNIGTLTELDCCFMPSKKRLKELWFTFLEMSGEDLKQVDMNNYSGMLPNNIDVFFKVPEISMTFILVTSHDQARNDDSLMVNFLDYLRSKNTVYRSSRVLLLVTKWDEVMGKMEIEDFIRINMPGTFKKIDKSSNAFRNFSIGTVHPNVDGDNFIVKFNPEPAERVFEWLYKTLTGKNLAGGFDILKKYV